LRSRAKKRPRVSWSITFNVDLDGESDDDVIEVEVSSFQIWFQVKLTYSLESVFPFHICLFSKTSWLTRHHSCFRLPIWSKCTNNVEQSLKWIPWRVLIIALCLASFIFSSSPDVEAVQFSETTVNPGAEKTGPQDFELRRVLGRGGYGKVF
jgi:hypothetical protein